MTDEPKPLTKAEVAALEEKAAEVGKSAPVQVGVQYGADIKYHEAQRSGYGAILQPAHNRCANLWIFSFVVRGTTCTITTCESDLVLISEIEDYLNGAKKRGVEAEPTQEIMDCIEEYLAAKNIGISQFKSC